MDYISIDIRSIKQNSQCDMFSFKKVINVNFKASDVFNRSESFSEACSFFTLKGTINIGKPFTSCTINEKKKIPRNKFLKGNCRTPLNQKWAKSNQIIYQVYNYHKSAKINK